MKMKKTSRRPNFLKTWVSFGLILGIMSTVTATSGTSPWHHATLGSGEKGAQDSSVVSGVTILKKAIQAAGGIEKFKQIQNFTIVTQSELGRSKTALKVTETIQLPNKTKQVMELATGSRTQVLYGSRSWKQINNDVSVLSALEKREMERGLFRDVINLFQNFDSATLRIHYAGQEILDGQTSHILEIKNLEGDFFNLYIDAETNIVRKKIYRGAPEVGLATMQETYSDYKEVEGILLPYRILVEVNGKTFTKSEVLEVKVNSALDSDFFLVN